MSQKYKEPFPSDVSIDEFREAVVTLQNHIEDVVCDTDWERIDPKLWNAVSDMVVRTREKSDGRPR